MTVTGLCIYYTFYHYFESVLFLLIEESAAKQCAMLCSSCLIPPVLASSLDCTSFSCAWLNLMLSVRWLAVLVCSLGTMHGTIQPRCIGRLYHLNLCEYTLWCSPNDETAKSPIVKQHMTIYTLNVINFPLRTAFAAFHNSGKWSFLSFSSKYF